MKKKSLSKLKKEDQDLEKMLSVSGWKSVSTKESKASFEAAAKTHLERKKKESRINIRVSGDDLNRLREMADREGIGYQTLMASVLHKYATGEFLDKRMVIALVGKDVLKGKSNF